MVGDASLDGLARRPCKLNAVQWPSLKIYIAFEISVCTHATKQLQEPVLVQNPGMAVVQCVAGTDLQLKVVL